MSGLTSTEGMQQVADQPGAPQALVMYGGSAPALHAVLFLDSMPLTALVQNSSGGALTGPAGSWPCTACR